MSGCTPRPPCRAPGPRRKSSGWKPWHGWGRCMSVLNAWAAQRFAPLITSIRCNSSNFRQCSAESLSTHHTHTYTGCLKSVHRQLRIGRACMPGGPMGSQRAPGGSPPPPPMRPRPPPERPANSGSSGPTSMPPPLTPGRPPPPRGPPMPGRSGAPGGRMPGGTTSLPPTGGNAGWRGRSTAWSMRTCC